MTFFLSLNNIFSGASSGIGAATAIHFAKIGFKLALCGRNLTTLAETAAKCLDINLKLSSDDVNNLSIYYLFKIYFSLFDMHLHY